VAFQERATAAGIAINVIRAPDEGYWSDVWMNKPFCFSNSLGRPTADQQFSTYYAKGAAWNEAFWNDDRFNQLLLEARPELDDQKRSAIYAEMQHILRDRGGSIIPVFNNLLMAHSDKLRHRAQVSSSWLFDGNRIAERWWFA
jgi:peptide/nickel transport system substrate-binding protein